MTLYRFKCNNLRYYWNLLSFIIVTLTFPWWATPLDMVSIIIFIALFVASYHLPFLCWCKGVCLALLLVSFHSHIYKLRVENVFHAGDDTTINVRVDSFFKQITYGKEYLLKLESVNGNKLPFFGRPVVKAVVPETIDMKLGEKWQLRAKLSPVYGRANEVGFDQERFFISQGWHAKAVIKSSQDARLLQSSDSLRFKVYQRVKHHLRLLPNRAMILALSFGDRSELTQQEWQQLKASGLIHLVAISGLHIGIAYLIGWKLGVVLRRVMTGLMVSPLICALSVAGLYAWLAGFSIPTNRALWMCSLLGLFTQMRAFNSPWVTLAVAMACLIALDPFSILSQSFWMSFCAVAVIYLISGYRALQVQNPLWKLFIFQCLLTMTILPVTAYFFSGVSLSSGFYNLFFVPWVSMVVVPLLFVSLAVTVIVPLLAPLCWFMVDLTLQPLAWSIQFASSSWITLEASYMPWLLFIPMLLLLKSLASLRLYRLMGLTFLLVLLLKTNKPDTEWQIMVMDVGHGLAVVIQKEGKYLLYDTGNRWQGGSIAEQVIEPMLKQRGINKLDSLILSHLDLDHAGGRGYIEQQFKPWQKISSQALPGYAPCVAGEKWHWNGLDFLALWPPKLVKRAYNPHSCVVRVSNDHFSILLSGDIDAISELLLAKSNYNLQSDVLLVPHHGSLTSSTSEFLDAVQPKVAIASLSKGSRWTLPHPKVLARYQQRNIDWMDTGEHGQISINIADEWHIVTERSQQSLRWYRQILRKGVE